MQVETISLWRRCKASPWRRTCREQHEKLAHAFLLFSSMLVLNAFSIQIERTMDTHKQIYTPIFRCSLLKHSICLMMLLSIKLGSVVFSIKVYVDRCLIFIFIYINTLYCFFIWGWSAQEFCSVGDDACLILWDARTGIAPPVKVIVLLFYI